ncbi:hypothetical protein BpHYR1_013809 [Brachionus plicatilis]|uniref:Uncharacterized protein n=1 Tax=Brachionus plicatilis TaxID=10195 RepID=A0A3M7SWL6_BRAPC|nr:hypothetical protein BpHYR1_013809 [Brachionus plicatilis]
MDALMSKHCGLMSKIKKKGHGNLKKGFLNPLWAFKRWGCCCSEGPGCIPKLVKKCPVFRKKEKFKIIFDSTEAVRNEFRCSFQSNDNGYKSTIPRSVLITFFYCKNFHCISQRHFKSLISHEITQRELFFVFHFKSPQNAFRLTKLFIVCMRMNRKFLNVYRARLKTKRDFNNIFSHLLSNNYCIFWARAH